MLWLQSKGRSEWDMEADIKRKQWGLKFQQQRIHGDTLRRATGPLQEATA